MAGVRVDLYLVFHSVPGRKFLKLLDCAKRDGDILNLFPKLVSEPLVVGENLDKIIIMICS
jgi:hypothetical protein